MTGIEAPVCIYCGFRSWNLYLLPNGGAKCRNHAACMKRRADR